MKTLIDEMNEYYPSLRGGYSNQERMSGYMTKIDSSMNAIMADTPNTPGFFLKSTLHEIIAEQFEPVIFKNSPFYFEMGMKPAKSWGAPYSVDAAGGWLFNHHRDKFLKDPKARAEILRRLDMKIETGNLIGIDFDHHYFNYSRVLNMGIEGILEEVEREFVNCAADNERDYLLSVQKSLNAVLRIADKFADKARSMLIGELEPKQRQFIAKIAETASNVPRRPPETFYEGLAAMIFLREVCGTIDGVGISVLGHPDKNLIRLYRQDMDAGRITAAEAKDWISRWMAPTDSKFDMANNDWPETSCALILGGCDENGEPIFNELTRHFIECHEEHDLVNPKLNCRYSDKSPDEYLNLISRSLMKGHNVYTLIHDETIFKSQTQLGKTIEEARNYGAGGCQEITLEGVENPTCPYYLNMPLAFDIHLIRNETHDQVLSENGWNRDALWGARNFEAFYREAVEAVGRFLVSGAMSRIENNWPLWPVANPCPFFSAALYDCVKNHRDYSEGGGRYQLAGISLVGLANMVDSIYAIKRICFDEKIKSVEEFAAILAENWTGEEALRLKVVNLPKFGHDNPDVDEIAARFCDDLFEVAKRVEIPGDATFEMSFFVYYAFVALGESTPATPDGRKAGDMFSAGISPARNRPVESITQITRSLGRVDFTKFPGNSVLDAQLPIGGVDEKAMLAIIRNAAASGIPTLQFNCVDVNTLRKAQQDPEHHQDLIVRISGLSARFVALSKAVQDEIITRQLMAS